MPSGYYKPGSDILKKLGFRYIQNAKGSHEKWQSETSGKILLVPRNLKSRHTANAILKTAGYTDKI